jgi:hypothetical protein
MTDLERSHAELRAAPLQTPDILRRVPAFICCRRPGPSVKKLMPHSCNTSVAHRASPGNVPGIWACVGLLRDAGTARDCLSLGGSSRHENGPYTRLARWRQVNLFEPTITVGRAKTSSGTGRVIPINDDLAKLLASHRAWFVERFGEPLALRRMASRSPQCLP